MAKKPSDINYGGKTFKVPKPKTATDPKPSIIVGIFPNVPLVLGKIFLPQTTTYLHLLELIRKLVNIYFYMSWLLFIFCGVLISHVDITCVLGHCIVLRSKNIHVQKCCTWFSMNVPNLTASYQKSNRKFIL